LDVLEGAERAANRVIFEDRPVNVRYGTADQLAQQGVRKEVDRKGILRAIEIERADLQPCGGTHVKSTGQIGLILVRRCSKMRQDWRVEFVCGGRAASTARHDFQLVRRTAEKLSSPPEELVEAAERAIVERDANFKTVRAVLQRLAEAEAGLALQHTPANASGLRIFARVFENISADYLNFFATEFTKSENTVALVAAADGGHVLFAQHPKAGRDMHAVLKEVLNKMGGKGGGTRDFARGKLSDAAKGLQSLDAAVLLIEKGA
jgi:alanyl-tRNA synthetase